MRDSQAVLLHREQKEDIPTTCDHDDYHVFLSLSDLSSSKTLLQVTCYKRTLTF